MIKTIIRKLIAAIEAKDLQFNIEDDIVYIEYLGKRYEAGKVISK